LFFTSGCSVRGLADCPPVARGPSMWCMFFACSSSSCEFARRSFEVSKFYCGVFVGPSVQRGRTIRGWVGLSAWRPRTVRAAPVARGSSVIKGAHWRICCLFRIVRLRVADCLPSACGTSAPALRTVRLVICRTAKSFAS
jgi:hypothetical protein